MRTNNWQKRLLRLGIFCICLSPFLLLINATYHNELGANPIEALHFSLGDWALRFLCLTLAVTPAKKLLKWKWVGGYRRMLGLYAFFYATMHFLVFVVLDVALSLENFIEEVKESPYILVGLATFITLIPLAITSTKSMQKRLGKKWLVLHKLVYLAGILAVTHYLWLVKTIGYDPLFYATVMTLLLGYRLLASLGFKKH